MSSTKHQTVTGWLSSWGNCEACPVTPDEYSHDQRLVNTDYGQEPSSVYSDKCSVARVKCPQRASQGRLSEDRREATQRGEPDAQCFVIPSPRTARDFKLKEKNKQGKCPESGSWLSTVADGCKCFGRDAYRI